MRSGGLRNVGRGAYVASVKRREWGRGTGGSEITLPTSEREKGGGVICWSKGVNDCVGSRGDCGNADGSGNALCWRRDNDAVMYKIQIYGYS